MTDATFAPAEPPSFIDIVSAVSRVPQQGRSRASLERMVTAARELMLERGNEDFTLQEVGKQGEVSIGSIYLRFESKDNLVRAVLAQALQDLSDAEIGLMSRLAVACTSLGSFIPAYVDEYAEVLRVHAPLLRLTMLRAENDELVASLGKQVAIHAQNQATATILRYVREFGDQRDTQIRAHSAFQIIFATLARQLSLGSHGETGLGVNWDVLKRELSRMILAYLRAE
ncbi:TetR family transcriptional regulator [Novosphingobium sp. FSY-8]|uniref:TetR family transcriptional regulator n=1 Tax=Novosphingobium ovatum TaxID=1908523 RepID=A0ABW9XGW4_9SPHN|nr:TetR/AcrR family transcriptional regulator [Novosphingobium ovatum]NBC37736.1 TetR family transcriptional regulator [Novosphingobium ovatum]